MESSFKEDSIDTTYVQGISNSFGGTAAQRSFTTYVCTHLSFVAPRSPDDDDEAADAMRSAATAAATTGGAEEVRADGDASGDADAGGGVVERSGRRSPDTARSPGMYDTSFWRLYLRNYWRYPGHMGYRWNPV